MKNIENSKTKSFRNLNKWILRSTKKFSESLKYITEGVDRLRLKLQENNSSDVEYDVECDPVKIYCLNESSEWIGISDCLPDSPHLDIFDCEENWDDLNRQERGTPTCYPLHDIESHWRYPIFKNGIELNPYDINELQLHVTVIRQAFFSLPKASEYPVFLSRLLDVERWLLEQSLVPSELNSYATLPSEFRVHVMRYDYAHTHGVDDVLIDLGNFYLRDLQKGSLTKANFKNDALLIPTIGFLDSLFMHKLLKTSIFHRLEHADMFWVEIENKIVLKSAFD